MVSHIDPQTSQEQDVPSTRITPLLKHQQQYLDRLITIVRHSTRERLDASRTRQQHARAVLDRSRQQLAQSARLRADGPSAITQPDDASREG